MFQSKKVTTAKESQQAQTNAFAACGVCIIFVLFILAYQHGTKKQTTISDSQVHDLKKRGEFLRKSLQGCKNKTQLTAAKAAELQGESADLWSSNRQLEQENDRLVSLNEDIERKNAECEENMALTKAAWKQEDAENKPRLSQLQTQNQDLLAKSQRLGDTKGMRHVLLSAALDMLKKQHRELRKEQMLPDTKIDPPYVDELVKKWRAIDADMVAQGKPGPMSNREGEVLPPNMTAAMLSKQKIVRVLDRFDKDKHAKEIFIPHKNHHGEWRLPGWLGRQGTQPLRHGTYVNSKLNPITGINRQMRVLYEYGLCAVGRNVTKLMYPTAFRRCKSCHSEYLHNYIETPLVLFCDDCKPQHTTNPFKLLCAGYSAERQYGSQLFWRMRSRLRFKGRFINLAEEFLEDNYFGIPGTPIWGTKTIGVRLPRDPDFVKNCETIRQSKRTVLSYEKLLKGREGVIEYSQDFDEQCMPPMSQVYARINQRVKELQEDSLVKVYMSVEGLSESEWYTMQDKIEAPLFRRLKTDRITEDNIVDTFIAASCNHLVLNRFDIKSSMILEAWMLWNNLEVKGTAVW